jgi:hypothetical protein
LFFIGFKKNQNFDEEFWKIIGLFSKLQHPINSHKTSMSEKRKIEEETLTNKKQKLNNLKMFPRLFLNFLDLFVET